MLESNSGKYIAAIVSVIFIAIALSALRSYNQPATPDSANYTMYVCTETGQAFRHKNVIGESVPVHSPYSGKNTGVPAEACYWTADGNTKDTPTWVLLNQLAGKPGPTFCPDCGRLVTSRNPVPRPGAQPPPTKEKYAARHAD